VAALQQAGQLLDQAAHLFGLLATGADLVAPDVDLGVREGSLDLAEVLISRSDERLDEVRARNDDGGRGLGRCHEVSEQSALIPTMVAATGRSPRRL
jgi:hypothetical protein